MAPGKCRGKGDGDMICQDGTTTTVLLPNADTLLMNGIAALLHREEGIEAIPGTPGEDVVTMARELRPDILLLDLDDAERHNLGAIREISRISCDRTRVIALSQAADIQNAALVFNHGGWGYELKNCRENELPIAIRRVRSGKRFVCSALGGDFVYTVTANHTNLASVDLQKFTETERKVLAIIKRGGTAKDIAAEQHTTVSTAETHVRNIRKKLNIHSRSELVRVLYSIKLD